MGFRISGSVIVATLIVVGVGGWMVTGDWVEGGVQDPTVPTIAERNAEAEAEAFTVRTVTVSSQERVNALNVRGRTKAEFIVPIRAETGGVVEQRLVRKGQRVEPGTAVCRIETGTRQASLEQAEAAFEQAQFDLEANEALLERGFATQSQIRGLRAARNSAKAQLELAQQELKRATIVATVGGIVQDPVAEVGDNLSPGGACVTLVNLDPMLLTAQVSERDIFSVEVGQSAQIELITGETHEGEVTFVGASADAQTRTFTVELSVPNPDGEILDGITADARIALASDRAFPILPSWLVLDDTGTIGVRTVVEGGVVAFKPVEIEEQTAQGFWVSGLDEGDEVITLGQDFVVVGEQVRTAPEDDSQPTLGEDLASLSQTVGTDKPLSETEL